MTYSSTLYIFKYTANFKSSCRYYVEHNAWTLFLNNWKLNIALFVSFIPIPNTMLLSLLQGHLNLACHTKMQNFMPCNNKQVWKYKICLQNNSMPHVMCTNLNLANKIDSILHNNSLSNVEIITPPPLPLPTIPSYHKWVREGAYHLHLP